MTVDLPVDLPGSNATPADRQPEPIYITVQKDLSLSLASEPIARDSLCAKLDSLTQADRSQRIYLRAAGYLRVALVGIEGAAPDPNPAEPSPPQRPDRRAIRLHPGRQFPELAPPRAIGGLLRPGRDAAGFGAALRST